MNRMNPMFLSAVLRSVLQPSVLLPIIASALVLVGLSVDATCYSSSSSSSVGCTPQAKSQATGAITLAVDACQEIENFVPPSDAGAGAVVGLICQWVDGLAPVATVVVNAAEWNAMKIEYLRVHGSLPHGMKPVTIVIDAGGK